MELRVGCSFDYEATSPTPTIVLVEPHPSGPHGVVEERWEAEPAVTAHAFGDLYGNRSRRFVLPAGATTFGYDATIEITGEPDAVDERAGQLPVERLPDHLLHFLLASRYCQSDALSGTAWELFGGTPPGWARVQAICDWIHENVTYGVPSTPLTTVVDVFEARGGMCRDFAHLGVTFCRALGIPARYTFGYMPDIGIPGPYPPMDFHAWFEAWLDDRWWTFDARFNVPRIGRVPIGHGRDAVDVAMITTFGTATLRAMRVWSDEVTDAAHAAPPAGDTATGPQAQMQVEA
jgi:transglutaminase-like putative cysteine protease